MTLGIKRLSAPQMSRRRSTCLLVFSAFLLLAVLRLFFIQQSVLRRVESVRVSRQIGIVSGNPNQFNLSNDIASALHNRNHVTLQVNKSTASALHNVTQNRAQKGSNATLNSTLRRNTQTTAPSVSKTVAELYQPGFRYSGEQNCSVHKHRFAVVVFSAPGNFAQRNAVRNTWGHALVARGDVRLVFLVGRPSVAPNSTDNLDQSILVERDAHNDMLLANFADSYRNLTLKSTAMLEYLTTFCAHVRAAIKVDDDVFVNTLKLPPILSLAQKSSRTIYGKLAAHWKPHRNRTNKYYVSESEYGGYEYPDFVTGPFYVITGDLFEDLYRTALRTTFVFLEDVFVTGIVAVQVGSRRKQAVAVTNARKHTPCNILNSVSLHKVSHKNMLDIYQKLSTGQIRCTIKKKSAKTNSKSNGKRIAAKRKSS